MKRIHFLESSLINLFKDETIFGDENDATSTKSIFLSTAARYFRALDKEFDTDGEIKFTYGAKSFSGTVSYVNEHIQIRIFQSGTSLSIFYECFHDDTNGSLTMNNIHYLRGLFSRLPKKEENEFRNVSAICAK